jgi:uncharacterized protein (TIGR02687 family)
MKNIESSLASLFQKHRIVFWYDEGGALRPEYEALVLPSVEKIELKNNAFGIKYHILREDQKSKLLIYHAGAEPKHQENWLLDVQLANAVFSADRASLWLAELGLPPAFKSLVAEHEAFFQSNARAAGLKERLESSDSQLQVRLKMMAACLGGAVDSRLESILVTLLEELAGDRFEKYESLEKFGLLPHLWKELERTYGYQYDTPHIKDFAIKLFESGYQLSLHEKSQMTPDALIFLNRWKDSVQGQKSFEILARQFEKALDIENKLSKRSSKDLLTIDLFKGIDHRILTSLIEKILGQTLTPEVCQEVINQRKATHWFKDEIAAMYHALEKAAGLLALIRTAKLQIQDFVDGFNKYSKDWFKIDQLYRGYIFHVRQSRETTFFGRLNEMVEAHYCNNYLLPLNNNWQLIVDQTQNWSNLTLNLQKDFFRDKVLSMIQSNVKVAVIISDALRFEVAEELVGKVEEAGRFTTELDWMAGMLPSYTALGMAALLPNETLSIQADGNVLVDGVSSAGLDNRSKILKLAVKGAAKALLANDLKAMSHDERRTLFRENQVVYVYHNQIDMVGDKRESEDQTVEAVAAAIDDLVELTKLLRSANFARILVTSDHGFLYQYQKLDEADLAGTEISGKEIFLKKRRFVIGKDLDNSGHKLKAFNAEQLGLAGDYEILLAKSVNRLKLSGAGMQFVHGGSSLQEIVIPVLAVNLVRGGEFEAREVEVDKLASASNTITTGQISVKFIQLEKISTKVLPRTLRVGIYAEDGKLISDVQSLYFGFESDNQRDREIEVRLILSKEWQKYNRQTVYLRLDQPIKHTEKFEPYKNWQYYLNKTQFAEFQ